MSDKCISYTIINHTSSGCRHCHQRWSRVQVHDLERDLTLGCLMAALIDISVSCNINWTNYHTSYFFFQKHNLLSDMITQFGPECISIPDPIKCLSTNQIVFHNLKSDCEPSIQTTGKVIKEKRHLLLPETPLGPRNEVRLPRHVVARGYVLADANDHSRLGSSLIVISGKASVYKDKVNFMT